MRSLHEQNHDSWAARAYCSPGRLSTYKLMVAPQLEVVVASLAMALRSRTRHSCWSVRTLSGRYGVRGNTQAGHCKTMRIKKENILCPSPGNELNVLSQMARICLKLRSRLSSCRGLLELREESKLRGEFKLRVVMQVSKTWVSSEGVLKPHRVIMLRTGAQAARCSSHHGFSSREG